MIRIPKRLPKDKHGNAVKLSAPVRLWSLSGQWVKELPAEEKNDVIAMIGQIFAVEEVDEYGKSWPDEVEGKCRSHADALEPDEMQIVGGNVSPMYGFTAALGLGCMTLRGRRRRGSGLGSLLHTQICMTLTTPEPS